MHHPSRRVRPRLDALEPREVPAGLIASYASGPGQVPREIGNFTLAGELAFSYPVPPGPGNGESLASDVVTAADGSWLVYNGTSQAALSIRSPGGDWRHGTLAGLSTVNNRSFGGLATAGEFAFLPDMDTAGAGAPKGIVRLTLDDLSAGERFFPENEYTDLNIGLDGMLYALRGDAGPIDVIEPRSMIRARTFFPGGGATSSIPVLTGVAADADGNVFVVSWENAVHRLDRFGTVLGSVALPGPVGELFEDTFDVNLSLDGSRLVVGSRFGWFVQLAADFTDVTYHRAGAWEVHVAFDEPPPNLPVIPLVSVNDPESVEGDGGPAALTFTVTLSEPADRPVTVRYGTANGTATAGLDYTGLADALLTFDPGQTSKTVNVNVTGDLSDEPDETVLLVLSEPINGVIADDTGAGLILDDDGTPIANIADAAPVIEGNAGTVPIAFTVRLTEVPKTAVSVNYATRDGTTTAGADYNPASGTLTFAPGQNTKTVTVTVVGERVAEAHETFDLVLSDPAGGLVLGDDVGTTTITNDDVPPAAEAGPDKAVNENGMVGFRAAGSAGVAPLTYSWDFGDGTTGTGFAPRHRFLDSGTYTVTLTVRDGNGSTATDTLQVTSNNLAPRGRIGGSAVSVPGWARPLTFTGSDPSPLDKAVLEYRINWGDGQTETLVGGPKLLAGHAYAVPGDYTVRMIVADDDGGTSREYTKVYRVKSTLLMAGTLYVPGTDGPDAIEVRSANPTGTKVEVAVNGTVAAIGSPGTVTVFGRDGDDTITVIGPVKRRLVLLGGAGNDTLDTSSAIGPVVLSGGDGADSLTGGSWRDVLIGGAGADELTGGGDDDVALGEGLTFGADPVGLRKLSLEWARTTTYESRRDRLLGVPTNGLNKPYYLAATTVVADGAIDTLTGGLGRDWFFDPTNALQDPAADETVTTLS